MKTLAFVTLGLATFVSTSVWAGNDAPGALAPAEPPHGNVIELHSCALYAGGCIVSSESPQGGHYMLRAWKFAGGAFSGTDFAGLQVALLQSSSDNLAADKTTADQAVIYLPKNANPNQRQALLDWVRASLPDLKGARLQTRIAPLHFEKNDAGYAFSAGEFVSVASALLDTCETGCGEALWYTPRTPTALFTVAVNRGSQVAEPLLKLAWTDSGKRSIFLGKFGTTGSAKNQYVTLADLCGPANRLF